MMHLTQADYIVARWSGGTTTQIAIAPPGASYGDRDFLWRVSSAVVEDERSTFTPLPDYHRWLLLLEGSLRLTHGGEPPLYLEPFQAHEFDGGAPTESVGLCRDFNLMLRKGECRGALRPLRFSSAGEEVLRCGTPGDCLALLLYCARGGGTVSWTGESHTIIQGESLLMEGGGELLLAVSAPADFVLAEIVR